MTTKTQQEKFEEAFLRGRDPKNPMVSCLITKYVGQENYSNPGTQAMFEMFQKGAASVVVDLDDCKSPDVHDGSGALDFTFTVEAIEAAGGTVKP